MANITGTGRIIEDTSWLQTKAIGIIISLVSRPMDMGPKVQDFGQRGNVGMV